MFFVFLQARTKKKFWVSMGNRTSDLWILLHYDAPPHSHKDSMVSKAHYKVYVRHRSCKLYNLHVIKCNHKKFVWVWFCAKHILFPIFKKEELIKMLYKEFELRNSLTSSTYHQPLSHSKSWCYGENINGYLSK